VAADLLGDGAQERAPDGRVAAVPEHDQVGPEFLGRSDQLLGRVAGGHGGGQGETMFAGLGLDLVGQPTGVGGLDLAFSSTSPMVAP